MFWANILAEFKVPNICANLLQISVAVLELMMHAVVMVLLLLLLLLLLLMHCSMMTVVVHFWFVRNHFIWKIGFIKYKANYFEGKCLLLTVISLLPLLLIDLLHCSQLLLQLHPPVLEPDLDLSLSETQRVSNLNPASPGEIVVEVELLLQLQSLEPGVGLSASSPGTTIGTFDNWDITIRSVHSYWRN